MRRSRFGWLMALLCVGLVLPPASAAALPKLSKKQRIQTKKMVRQVQSKHRLLAQSTDSQAQATKHSAPKGQTVPRAAWVLETVSTVVAGLGFITFAVSATILGRRDQILESARNPSPLFPAEPVNAKEIKELQDTGFPLLYTGLIVAGVGLAGMVIGGVWLLSHRPHTTPLPPDAKVGAASLSNPSADGRVLLHVGQL